MAIMSYPAARRGPFTGSLDADGSDFRRNGEIMNW